ncbi:MAG: methyltransferase domain-containing protein [Candidatus Sumerlaeota bacterium]|nr:methyltransferase domain-containing protein [Candidatus Sumerlaeota bacterium]
MPRRKQDPFVPPPGLSAVDRWIARLQHPVYNFPYDEIDRFYRDEQGRPKTIVSLGGGPSRFKDFEFNLNIERFPGVDLIGDAHHLPFPNESLDGVHANATLEHVEDPRRVAAEIWRALKPGGQVFTIHPFLHPYHGHPRDYHRFSYDTIRLVFRDFEPIWTGVNVGPHYGLLKWIETYILTYFPVFLPFGKRTITKAAQLAFWSLFFWVKYLDRWIFNLDSAHILAHNTLFIGRKPVGKG